MSRSATENASPPAVDVLIHVEDPGAANLVLDLPGALAAQGVAAALLAEGSAVRYLDERACPALPRGAATAADLLSRYGARLLAVGTSQNPDGFALALIDAARARGMCTVGLVDMAVNAENRFRGRTDDPLAHAPDWLVVSDEVSGAAYRALGFPADRIVVSGSPHYDRVIARRRWLETQDLAALRAEVLPGAPPGRPVVVFAAEGENPLNPDLSVRGPDYTLHGRGGDEFRSAIVLEEVIDALAGLSPHPWLVLRLHPNNRPEDFADQRGEVDGISAGGDPLALVACAALVVGMTSMLLVETMLLGRPALSVVPRAVEAGWLPAVGRGRIPVASTRSELRERVRALLAGPPPPGRPPELETGALEALRAFLLARLCEG